MKKKLEEFRVLVVDDMENIRLHIAKLLSELKIMNVDFAQNGIEGQEKVELSLKENNVYDLIISDWNMPVCSGIDFLRKMKNNPDTKKIPFIMATTEKEEEKILDAISLGVSNYLTKPFAFDGFKERLAQVFPNHF